MNKSLRNTILSVCIMTFVMGIKLITISSSRSDSGNISVYSNNISNYNNNTVYNSVLNVKEGE